MQGLWGVAKKKVLGYAWSGLSSGPRTPPAPNPKETTFVTLVVGRHAGSLIALTFLAPYNAICLLDPKMGGEGGGQ